MHRQIGPGEQPGPINLRPGGQEAVCRMATNIEIKARVRDRERLRQLAETLSDTPCVTLLQEDTFFNTPGGRLKLRSLAPDQGQLIYYVRDDAAGPKRSNYVISTTTEPDALKAVLAASLGIRGVVRKQRLLYMAGNTRIHLDEVQGLGDFMELEVVLLPGQSEQEGQATAVEIMEKLGIKDSDLVEVAYIDLLEKALELNDGRTTS
jgi:predicted adenylyl cyclase CyaB